MKNLQQHAFARRLLISVCVLFTLCFNYQTTTGQSVNKTVPGTVAASLPSGGGTFVNWSTSANAIGDDNGYTSVVLPSRNNRTYNLSASNFGFSTGSTSGYIPSGATISGILVEIKMRASGTVKDFNVQLMKAGTAGGTSLASTANWPSTGAYVSYGSSTELWGQTWAVSDITATGFGVVINAKNAGKTSATAEIDNIRITVYYNNTAYYSKSSGFLAAQGTWGTNTDGTGSSPSSFSADAQIFNLVNRTSTTLDANFSISGVGSKLVVGNGSTATTFTIPSGYSYTGNIDVKASSVLSIQNTTIPTIKNLDVTSEVRYEGSTNQNVAEANYGKLTLTGSGTTKTLQTGTVGISDVNSTLTIGSGCTFTINNAVTAEGDISNNGTVSGTGELTQDGTAAATLSGTGSYQILSVNNSSGVTLSGATTINGTLKCLLGTVSNGTNLTLASGALLNIDDGSLSSSLTFTNAYDVSYTMSSNKNTSVELSGSGLRNISLGADLSTVTLTATGNITMSGSFTNTTGTFDLSNKTLTIGGNFTNNSNFTQGTSTITFNGSGTQTISSSSASLTLYNVILTKTAGTTLNTGGSLTSLSVQNFTETTGNFTAPATLTVNGNLLISAGTFTAGTTINLTGNFTVNGTFTPGTSTIVFNGTGAQTISSTSASLSLYNITLSKTAGTALSTGGSITTLTVQDLTETTGNFTAPATLNVNGNLLISAGTFTSGSTINAGGNFTNNSTFTQGTSTITFNGSGTQTISSSSASLTLYNVVLSKTAGTTLNTGGSITTLSVQDLTETTGNFTAPATLNINGNLLISAGTFTAGTTINVAGNFTNNGTFTPGTSTIVFNGSGTQTISSSSTSLTLNNVTLSKTAGTLLTTGGSITTLTVQNLTETTGNFTAPATLNVNGNLLISAGTFTAGTTINAGGNFTNNSTFTQGTSTLVFNGTGTQTLSANTASFSIYHLTLSKTAGTTLNTGGSITSLGVQNFTETTGNFTAPATFTVNGNFSIAAGTYSAGTALTVKGSFSNAGTFTSNSGSVSFSGSTQQTFSQTGTAVFNNISVNNASGISLNNDMQLSGTLTFATTGKITTNSSSVVLTTASASVSGAGSSAGWVTGNLKKYITSGAVSKTFEIGGSTAYRPVSVSFASVTTAGSLTVSITDANADHPQIASSPIDATKSVNRYWTITNSGIVFTTADVTLNWITGDVDAGASTSAFGTGLYNGTDWQITSFSSASSTSIVAGSLTSFGDIAAGERNTFTTWTGAAATSDWFTSSNWSNDIPSATRSSVIPSTVISGRSFPTISSGTANTKDITVGSGTITNNSTLKIAGTISASGTINSQSGTIEMNATQNVAGSYFTNRTLKGLTINTTGNTVTLTDSLNITDVLTITAGTFNLNNQPLVLRSTSSNTARIAPILGTLSNATKVTVERFIPQSRRVYRLVAPSVTTSTSINANWQEGVRNTMYGTNINPNPGYGVQITGTNGSANGFDANSSNSASLFTYTNPNPSAGISAAWVGVTNTLTNTLDATKGYLLFVRGDRSTDMTSSAYPLPTNNTTIRATGTVRTGDVTFSALSNTGASLITNPYPSPISWSSVYSANSGGNLSSFYTYWEPTIGTRGGYVTVGTDNSRSISGGVSVGTGSVNATTDIQSGQAFFVRGTFNGTSSNTLSVTIKEAHKSTTNNIRVFTPLAQQPKMYTNLYFYDAAGVRRLADGQMVRFDDSYSKGYDAFDGDEVTNFDENIRWRTDGKNLAIDSRPLTTSADTLFMQTAKFTTQTYELEFIPEAMGDKNVTAQLFDKYTGTFSPIDMNVTTVIPIVVNTSIAATTDPDRFYVVLNANAPLPVTLTSVKAYQKGSGINVEWNVQNEQNLSSYEVEKSSTGANFSKAAVQNATGNAAYSWFDANPNNGVNFYRIKSVDKNGAISYSKVVKVVTAQGAPMITVYPNPVVGNTVALQFTNIEKGTYPVTITNKLGQVVYQTIINHTGGSATQTFDVSNRLAQGIYQLSGAGFTVQLIKQ